LQVLWFSTNFADDLCFTSQRYIAEGIQNSGVQVTFLNPDNSEKHSSFSWHHVSVSRSNVPGLQAASLAKNMCYWLDKQNLSNSCVAVIDWRLARRLVPICERKKIKWILLDRSPPADTGLLAKLQWPFWRKAWKLVTKSSGALGSVVSEKHLDFVKERISIDSSKIIILSAGVDLKTFTISDKPSILTLVYHGRLDRHRGVLSLPMLVTKARSEGLELKLKLIGNGDRFEHLLRISENDASIEVYPRMSQKEISKHLRDSTIGLLPMPNTGVWGISSPLKRSEYCASGLPIFGIDHQGHRFGGDENYSWMKLVPQHDFHEEAINWLKSLDSNAIEKLSQEARVYAENHLSWDVVIDKMIQSIKSLK